jgi:hypothetical protein
MLPHPIMNIDKFFDCVGNLAINPTAKLPARMETSECLLFCFNLAIDDEILNNPFLLGTHICA